MPVHIFNYQLLTPRRRCPEAFQARRINAMLRGFKQGLGWTPDKVFVNFPTFSVGLTEIFAEEVPSIAVFHLSDVINLKLDDGPRVRSHLERFRTWGYRNPGIGHFLKERFDRASVPVYSGIDEDLIADAGVIENKKHPASSPALCRKADREKAGGRSDPRRTAAGFSLDAYDRRRRTGDGDIPCSCGRRSQDPF